MMLASAVLRSMHQAATWKKNKTGWWWEEDNESYPVSTWKRIGGIWYYFDQNGYMKSGWLKDNGTWYYLGGADDRSMKTWLQRVNGAGLSDRIRSDAHRMVERQWNLVLPWRSK